MRKREELLYRPPKRKPKKKDVIFILLMLLPAAAMTIWLIYYPIGRGITMSFQEYNLYNLNNIKFIGFENFGDLLKPGPFNAFYGTVKNTIIYVFGSLIPQVLFGFILALLLQKRFRGRSLYQGIIFFPWAVSGFIIGIMWRWMFNGSGGVINDFFMRLGVISEPVSWLSSESTAMLSVIIANVWYGIPFFVIMITAALQSVPMDLYEAADVDGAGALVKFRVITLPHIKSVLILTTLLRVIWIFNGPETIFAMTNGGPAGSTQIMTSYMYSLITSLDYGRASAVGVICTLILVAYALLYLRISRFTSEE
ncbi:MAG: sugar ABC transporter permease [Lachnospiraceae bacterium]|nr:sugar ABC transporter permease [Lachnospiraceae bacterium]